MTDNDTITIDDEHAPDSTTHSTMTTSPTVYDDLEDDKWRKYDDPAEHPTADETPESTSDQSTLEAMEQDPDRHTDHGTDTPDTPSPGVDGTGITPDNSTTNADESEFIWVNDTSEQTPGTEPSTEDQDTTTGDGPDDVNAETGAREHPGAVPVLADDSVTDDVIIGTPASDSESVTAVLEQAGVDPDDGTRIVTSAGARNGAAANDARTKGGLGNEFGVWGAEFIHVDGALITRPTGSGKASEEMIAGRELEANEINDVRDRFGIPDSCRCGGTVELTEDGSFECDNCHSDYTTLTEIQDTAAKNAIECRTGKAIRDARPRRITIAGNFYNDAVRGEDSLPDGISLAPARRTAALDSSYLDPARDFHTDFIQTESVVTDTTETDDTTVSEPITCPYADETRDEAPPTVHQDELDAIDAELDERATRLEQHDLALKAIFGTDSAPGIVDHFHSQTFFTAANEPDVRSNDPAANVTERTRELPIPLETLISRVCTIGEDADSTMDMKLNVKGQLFHTESTSTRSLADVTAYWPAASVRVRVTNTYDPAHPSQHAVFDVTDASPLVNTTSCEGNTAKVTVWKRSGITDSHSKFHTKFNEGDELILRNVKPSQYRNRLTLAATSDSTITRLTTSNSELPAPDDIPAQDTPITDDGTPQSLSLFESNTTLDRINLHRYRRTTKTLYEPLGIGESIAAQGPSTERHRDYFWALHTDVVTGVSNIDEFYQRPDTLSYTRYYTAADAQTEPPTNVGDEYTVFSHDGFKQAISTVNDTLGTTFEEMDAVGSVERVYRHVLDDSLENTVDLRVYSSVLGEWTAGHGDSSILVTVETNTGDVLHERKIHRSTDATRWQDRLTDAVKTVLETFTDDDDGVTLDATPTSATSATTPSTQSDDPAPAPEPSSESRLNITPTTAPSSGATPNDNTGTLSDAIADHDTTANPGPGSIPAPAPADAASEDTPDDIEEQAVETPEDTTETTDDSPDNTPGNADVSTETTDTSNDEATPETSTIGISLNTADEDSSTDTDTDTHSDPDTTSKSTDADTESLNIDITTAAPGE